jgi:hypothetical protein
LLNLKIQEQDGGVKEKLKNSPPHTKNTTPVDKNSDFNLEKLEKEWQEKKN